MFQSISEFLSNTDALLTRLAYERSSQLYFQSGIKKYTGNSEFEIELRDFVNKNISPSLVNIKIFTYQNAIISLYGYLERFIEDIIDEYLRNIHNACTEFNCLPLAIKKNHFNSSLDLLLKTQRLKSLTPEQRKLRIKSTVGNMYSCLLEDKGYFINYEAFTTHNSNFRYDSIHEIFSRVGINRISRDCLNSKEFLRAIAQKHYIDDTTEKKILVSLLISELDDLAQRRNEIAHGARIDELESIELLITRIMLIRAYGVAINEVVTSYLNIFLYDATEKICLGKPAKAFNDIRVIGFNEIEENASVLIHNKIKIGSKLFAVNEKSTERVISGQVISIRKGMEKTTEIALPCNTEFTLEVDFCFNSNITKRTFYITRNV